MKKAVIFDMDGVLVDTEPIVYRMMKDYFRPHGFEMEYDEFQEYIGLPGRETFRRIVERHGLAEEPSALGKAFTEHYVRAFPTAEGYEPIPGVRELIEALHEMNVPMGVASSSPQGVIEMTVERLGLKPYFRTMVSAQSVKAPKPAPDVYLRAAEELRLDPSECVAVEDTAVGIRAANDAGLVSVAFRNPSSGNQDFGTADAVIDDMRLLNPYILLGLSK